MAHKLTLPVLIKLLSGFFRPKKLNVTQKPPSPGTPQTFMEKQEGILEGDVIVL